MFTSKHNSELQNQKYTFISRLIGTHPALSCDFDDGMCDWFQHDNDEQDWQRQTGSTGTSRTGPSHDHTHGADGEGTQLFK